MASAPIILVPGSGSARGRGTRSPPLLRADGHDVTALTLPGLESKDADRSAITFQDHVDAIVRALEAADRPASSPSTARRASPATRRATRCPSGSRRWSTSTPRRERAPLDPDFADAEKPLDWESVSAEENLDGISEEQMATFRERAVPVPGGVLRDGYSFTNDARRDIPSTSSPPATPPPTTRTTPGSTRIGRSWPGSPSCATSPGSTCRRATGRCGRSRRTSPGSSARSRSPPGDHRPAWTGTAGLEDVQGHSLDVITSRGARRQRRPSAASTGSLRSTPSTMRMNRTPNGMPRASGPRTSRKNATRCVGSSSVARDLLVRPRTVMVARPAARRLRTQWTSPHGAQTQRRPATSMIATGVVRGRPLFRPRMVMSPLKPSGTPAASRALAIGLKIVTHAAVRRRRCQFDRSCDRLLRASIRSWCHRGDPQEGPDVTAAERSSTFSPRPP